MNDFLAEHRDGEAIDLNNLSTFFIAAAATLDYTIGRRAFRLGTQVNAAILDSVFVGVMERIQASSVGSIDKAAWEQAYDGLLANEDFIDAVTKATANEESVYVRLREARAAFSQL